MHRRKDSLSLLMTAQRLHTTRMAPEPDEQVDRLLCMRECCPTGLTIHREQLWIKTQIIAKQKATTEQKIGSV